MKQSLQELVLRHLKAENRHDMDATLDTLHPECVFEDFGLGWTYHGRQGAKRYYDIWWNAFKLTVVGETQYWSDANALIAEARFTGKHVGQFCGVPATGNDLDLRIAVFVHFRDGLMAGERFYYDSRSLFSQLGVVDTSSALTSGSPACAWPSLVQPA